MRRHFSLATLAVMLAVMPSRAQDAYLGVDEALEALEAGRLRAHRISPRVVEEAISLIREAEPKELDDLVKITKRAKADRDLAKALAERFIASPQEKTVLRYLPKLRSKEVFEGTRDLDSWIPSLLAVIEDKAASPPHYMLTLLATHASGDTVMDTLTRWGREEPPPPTLRSVLLDLRWTQRPPVEILQGLLRADLPEAYEAFRHSVLNKLVRDEKAALYALGLLDKGEAPVLYRSLGSFPRRLSKRVRKTLLERMRNEADQALADLIHSAARMRVTEAFPLIVSTASDGDGPARVAALETLPSVMRALKASKRSGSRSPEADSLIIDVAAAIQDGLGSSEEVLAASIRGAAALGLEDGLGQTRLLAWASREEKTLSIRVAALAAITATLELDRPTATLLVDLLGDPKVSRFAHNTLKGLSKIRLPANQELWQSWLRRVHFEGEADR